jgi:hypothetical protein
MSQAMLFYQTIAAYPGSKLSQDYVAALQAAKEAAEAKADGSPQSADAVATAIENALQSFFKGTTVYNQVTMAHLAAVDAYHTQLPFPWARRKDDFTYYLYGSDDTSSLFAGTLTLKKSGAVDVTKTNGGYTCQFVPAVASADLSKADVDDSKSITLTYKDGLFVDNPETATPKIALHGDYMLNRMFTVNADDNSLVTIISGVVNGLLCIGLDSPQKSDSSEKPIAAATSSATNNATIYWERLTHPKSMTDWVVSIMTLVGTVLLVPALAGAVYGIYRIAKYREGRQTLLNRPVKYRIDVMENKVRQFRNKWGPAGKQVIPEYGLELLVNVADMNVTLSIKLALNQSLMLQRRCIKTMQQFSTTLDDASKAKLQSILTSINKSEEILSKKDFNNPQTTTENAKALQDEYQTFAKNQDDFEGIYKKFYEDLDFQWRASIGNDMVNVSFAFERLKEAQEKAERGDEESDPSFDWGSDWE